MQSTRGSENGANLRSASRVRVVVIVAMLTSWAGAGRAEVIDRVLAVVGSRIITLSDARAVLVFGFVQAPPSGDRIQAAMERLIERTLMLTEVQRYLPPEPTAANIDARFDAVRRRFATDADFERALATTGLSRAHVREMVRDELRIESYIDDRFASAMQPGDDEVLAYARAHRAEIEAAARTPDEQLALARTRLIAERRQARIAEWVNGLRRRADVTELYLPGAAR